MGSLLRASCPCGYTSPTIPAGGGFATFQTICAVPALCPTCKEVVGVNAMNPERACPKCGEAVILCGGLEPLAAKHDRVVFNWNVAPLGTYVLDDRAYRCPKCGEVKMTFRDDGCWD